MLFHNFWWGKMAHNIWSGHGFDSLPEKCIQILIIKNSEPLLMSSRINKILLLFQPSKESIQESSTNFHKLMVCPFFHNHSGMYRDFYLYSRSFFTWQLWQAAKAFTVEWPSHCHQDDVGLWQHSKV